LYSYYIKFYASSHCLLSISKFPHWSQSPEVCITDFQEQYYVLKPDEASTRLFYLRASTDKAAKYQCTGGLKIAVQLSISCVDNVIVLIKDLICDASALFQLFSRRQILVNLTDKNAFFLLWLQFLIMEHRFGKVWVFPNDSARIH